MPRTGSDSAARADRALGPHPVCLCQRTGREHTGRSLYHRGATKAARWTPAPNLGRPAAAAAARAAAATVDNGAGGGSVAACWAAAARETPQDDGAGAAASESGRRFPRLGPCGRAEPGGRQAPRVHRRWGAASSLCSWLNRQLAESHNRSFRKLVTKALRGCGPSTARRQRGAAARRSGSRRLARIRVEGAQSSSDRDASGRSRTRTWLLRRFSGIWYVLPQPLLLGSGPLPSFSLDDAGDGDRSLIWCCGIWARLLRVVGDCALDGFM